MPLSRQNCTALRFALNYAIAKNLEILPNFDDFCSFWDRFLKVPLVHSILLFPQCSFLPVGVISASRKFDLLPYSLRRHHFRIIDAEKSSKCQLRFLGCGFPQDILQLVSFRNFPKCAIHWSIDEFSTSMYCIVYERSTTVPKWRHNWPAQCNVVKIE